MGQIAAVIVLAGLAVAVGMAFPDAKAAAQGSHGGYTYTERTCQEYGQAPRRYLVRDPIPGSDWRNDGGWAIIQEHGSYHLSYSADSRGAYVKEYSQDNTEVYARFVPDANGNPTLLQRHANLGVFTFTQNPTTGEWIRTVDGNHIRVRSYYVEPNWSRYQRLLTGGIYIRWANLAWCR